MESDPLGLIDMVQRDVDRASRALALPQGNGIRRVGQKAGPFPRYPMPIPATTANGRPQTPPELIADIPNQVSQTLETGLNLIGNAPQKIAEDLTLAVSNLLQLPRNVIQEAFITPGKLADRFAPGNINKALETVRESADFTQGTPADLRARMRTITDVIDLFTPT